MKEQVLNFIKNNNPTVKDIGKKFGMQGKFALTILLQTKKVFVSDEVNYKLDVR